MLKTLKQKDTDYQFPTEALYTRKREWGWKLSKRRNTHAHTARWEEQNEWKISKQQYFRRDGENNSTKKAKAKVNFKMRKNISRILCDAFFLLAKIICSRTYCEVQPPFWLAFILRMGQIFRRQEKIYSMKSIAETDSNRRTFEYVVGTKLLTLD